MLTNIKDYVKIYDNVIDKQFCRKIMDQVDQSQLIRHKFYDHTENRYKSFNSEFLISNIYTEESSYLSQTISHLINKYILKDIGYKWFRKWDGFSDIRYNRYDVDTEMRLHCDHIHSMFDGNRKGIPVLSILGALNNDYEGGDLIFWDSEKINLKAGQIMIFPSNFLYPHKVEKITKGSRYTFVTWVW